MTFLSPISLQETYGPLNTIHIITLWHGNLRLRRTWQARRRTHLVHGWSVRVDVYCRVSPRLGIYTGASTPAPVAANGRSPAKAKAQRELGRPNGRIA